MGHSMLCPYGDIGVLLRRYGDIGTLLNNDAKTILKMGSK